MKGKFNILGSVNPTLSNAPKAIDVSLIDCDARNFYATDRDSEDKRIELLAEEIMEVGFRSVIEVRPTGDRYCVIAGETRLKAMQLAYKQTQDPQFQFIPCFVNQSDDDIHNHRRLIMDNLLQREMTPALKMQAIEELTKSYQAEKASGVKLPGRIAYLIAQDIGLGKSQVSTYQTVINKGAEAVKEAIKDEKISLDAAAKLSTLPKQEQEVYINSTDTLSSSDVAKYVEEKKVKSSPLIENEELDIYDFLPDEESYDQEDMMINENEDIESCNKDLIALDSYDQKLLDDVMEQIEDYTQELDSARIHIRHMHNSHTANKIESMIEEIQDIIHDLKSIS